MKRPVTFSEKIEALHKAQYEYPLQRHKLLTDAGWLHEPKPWGIWLYTKEVPGEGRVYCDACHAIWIEKKLEARRGRQA